MRQGTVSEEARTRGDTGSGGCSASASLTPWALST